MELNKKTFTKFNFSETALFILLFLFPILSLSVRHWLSGIFTAITLLGLFFVLRGAWRGRRPLYMEEKVLFAIVGFYLLSALISSTVSGWSESSYHRLGTELKYLAFFVIYLYVRQHPGAWRGLILALPFGGLVIGAQALYDTFYTNLGYGAGVYGPIIFGDLAALLAGFALVFALTNRNLWWVGVNLFAVVMAVIAVVYSGSRNAWLAILISLAVLPVFLSSRLHYRRVVAGYLAIIPVVFIMVWNTPESITSRLGLAADQFKTYFSQQYTSEKELFDSSVGVRLELWRAAAKIIAENPILGVGPGNMGIEMNKLVERGEARQAVYRNPDGVRSIHVHSAYFEILGAQGIIGFIALMLMLLYPYYIFVQNKRYDMRIAGLGIIHMTGFIIFSLTEVPFIHDNFSSIFLIYLSVFFAWIINAKYNARPF